jgi:hypothetical protein
VVPYSCYTEYSAGWAVAGWFPKLYARKKNLVTWTGQKLWRTIPETNWRAVRHKDGEQSTNSLVTCARSTNQPVGDDGWSRAK